MLIVHLQRVLRAVRVPKHIFLRIDSKVGVLKRPYHIPPSQYDQPLPPTLLPWRKELYRSYPEIMPIIVITLIALAINLAFVSYFIKNKMDVTYASHSSANTLSRTMSLCDPKIYKLITIDQIYEPWPEMQMILDKMKHAEKKLALDENKKCGGN